MRELKAPHIIERTAAKLGIKADYRTIMKSYIKKITVAQDSERNLVMEFNPYTLDWAKRFPEILVDELRTYRHQRRLAEMEERQGIFLKNAKDMKERTEENLKKWITTRGDANSEKAKIEYDKLKTLHADLVDVEIRLDKVGQVRVEVIGPDMSTVEKLSRISSVLEPLQIGTSTTGLPIKESAGDNADGTAQTPLTDLGPKIVTPQLVASESEWRVIARRIHTLKAKQEELFATGKLEGHAEVKAIIKEINTAEVLLEGELASAMDRLKIESDHLIDLQKTLNAKMPEYHKSMAAFMEVTNAEQIISGSMVQWKVHLENLTKEQERIEYAIEREHVVFNYSGITEINDVPVSPNRFTLLMLTTIVGIGMGLGIPFLIEYLDHTLSNLEEVETTFQLRGLGIVPKLESADTTVAMMDVEQSKKTHLLENFRVIRTNLLSMGSVTKAPHVMMVTSAMPKEGKTVVSSNLALSFAQTGAKTLLMDTDLRRGRLHRLFGYRKQPGLSGVLLGQHSLEDAIRPTAHENLFILSAGQHLETGTELLGSQQFKDVMITLRQRFERIVVDTPPVLGLSETSVIQSLIDGVLFVIWSGHTPVKAVKSAIEMLQSNGANFYGFILNRLDLSASANYYQYYYYSHDYYYHYTPRPLENIT